MAQKTERIFEQTLDVPIAVATHERFVVRPVDTGLTAEQWTKFRGMTIDEILEAAED